MKFAALLVALSAVCESGLAAQTEPAEQRRLVDLSHTVEHDMVTYKGLPAPVISDHLSREQSRANYAPGTEFQIGKITMVANTGTYLDAPSHRFEDGADLADLELASLADLPSVLIRVTKQHGRAISRAAFAAGIPIIEHLCNLQQLPASGFRFSAVPVKVKDMGTFPVRAYAAFTP